MKVIHGNVNIKVDEFEFDSRMYGGSILVSYVRNNDRSIDWEPEFLRVVDVTDGEADWEDDDNLHTIPLGSHLAKALLAEYDDFVEDECRDDCRFD